MNTTNRRLERTELLLGRKAMNQISTSRVILFGVGGVGSWCAESLVRSGIQHLTIVDTDWICETNINRQLMATTKTVGQVKVEVLKARLLDINPDAKIEALQQMYSTETADSFHLNSYNYIIDAIDSLEHKVHLIRSATSTNATFFSSMGAALKMDSSKIKVAEFWKVQGCPLGAALRRKIRKGEKLTTKFMCVYSEEVLENRGVEDIANKLFLPHIKIEKEVGNNDLLDHDWNMKKAQINGTIAHITAIFGFRLAGLVIEDIYNNNPVFS